MNHYQLSMNKKKIPEEVKEKILQIIKEYNATVYANLDVEYFAEFRSNYLYLKRKELTGDISPIARLTYAGKMKDWEFAIYKWSTENYDPDELFFPGSKHVDGTILGALIAGNEAYPIDY